MNLISIKNETRLVHEITTMKKPMSGKVPFDPIYSIIFIYTTVLKIRVVY